MFNLEQSIADWRRRMLAAGIKTPVLLEELESHLREEFERQVNTGLTKDTAFEQAVRQIGRGEELKTEFARGKGLTSILGFEITRKERDLKWGPVLHLAVTTAIILFFGTMVLLKKGSFSGATSIERISSLAAIALSYLLSCGGFLGHRFFPVVTHDRPSLGMCVAGAALVALWWMFADTNCQFQVMFLWAFLVPFGAFSGLILGLERAAHKKIGMADS